MSFTDQQKIDIRRHLGYPVFGGQPVQAFGHRFYQWYGTLEFRMNNLSPAETSTVVNTYLADCNTLEPAIVGASANLDTDKAAVWTHNKNEVSDRVSLYNYRRGMMAKFFGVPLDPTKGQSSGVTFVV